MESFLAEPHRRDRCNDPTSHAPAPQQPITTPYHRSLIIRRHDLSFELHVDSPRPYQSRPISFTMKDPPKSKERGAYALVNRKEEEERGNILAEHAEKDEEADELEDVSDYLLEKNEPLDPEAEKRLVKKIDRRIMPILIAMIVLNYLDRNALANARIQGIETSLRLTGSQFNT